MFMLQQTTHRMTIRYHPRIGHLWVANQNARIPHERGSYRVRTNAQGFRSDLDFQARRGVKPRILVFGDSMTAGDGCFNAERFTERLGEKLDAEVYNYGVSGSATDQHLLIWREFAKDVDASLVVIAVSVHNIDRIKSAFRPTIDRESGRKILIPKPYFTLDAEGGLELHHVPVPIQRPSGEGAGAVHTGIEHREGNPQLGVVYRLADALRAHPRTERLGRWLSPQNVHDHSELRFRLLRLSGFEPLPDYLDPEGSAGCRLMAAIVRRFVEELGGRRVLIVPIPDHNRWLGGLPATYQAFYERFADPERGVHVLDVTTPLQALPFAQRKRLQFERDAHFSPFGHEQVAELLAGEIRARGLLPEQPALRLRERSSEPEPARAKPIHVLGLSCFYHDSAASLVRDGEIVAAAEEERFTRVKNDRRFPAAAANFCLEQGGIDAADLDAVVYYDDPVLTFERLMHGAVAAGTDGRDLWKRMMPSWVRYKLRLPDLIRRYLRYDGPVLRDQHHRSHAASAFYPSPFQRAAILTVDGVGEWATASIGVGVDEKIELLREMHFPNSLGLLYSAFTQFTGFKVNNGEYKMMGLAPYGRPCYVDRILEHLVDLHEDGSLDLHMENFAFLSGSTMTSTRFAELFGGPARASESRITQREMDIARSVQEVTELALLRMARHAKRLTGETRLCLAGGVALNCVANGRLLREGPFEDIWVQPAAGDSGGALGAALDVYHTRFGRPRAQGRGGRALQGGSFLGPSFSDDEIGAFLDTYGYPYRKLEPEERADVVAELLAAGKVVGHFAGRTEFGPRALGSRSILGDPRDREMQVKLNLKIKYRESFRPFAPVVLEERLREYFELDRESPYMMIVAPVKQSRRLPFERGDGEDLLEIVRRPRSDIPAVTHVDYSARIQTVTRDDHQLYYDVVHAFEKRTGCAVLVNTSFNVRGEPIVNTPPEAYRCFMRTEMDALVLGNYLLHKDAQPPSGLEKGGFDENAVVASPVGERLLAALERIFDNEFLAALRELERAHPDAVSLVRRAPGSAWRAAAPTPGPEGFAFPEALNAPGAPAERVAEAVVGGWTHRPLAEALRPVLVRLLRAGERFADDAELAEEVSESVYVMF
jgi:carbamoyltransferase